MRRFVLITLCFVMMVMFSGCETIAGVSKDIGNTARNIRDVFNLGQDIHNASK